MAGVFYQVVAINGIVT